MINGRPSREPTSDERSAALEREHTERMNRTRQVRLEYIKVRETAASVRETWHRLLDEREGTGDHELRRAALNILEDAERAEAAQRASEALYRTLFESIDEAFCIIEVLFD